MTASLSSDDGDGGDDDEWNFKVQSCRLSDKSDPLFPAAQMIGAVIPLTLPIPNQCEKSRVEIRIGYNDRQSNPLVSSIFGTHVFEVGCLVEVGDLDVGGLRRVRALLLDQLAQLRPPQQLLRGGTEKEIRSRFEMFLIDINTSDVRNGWKVAQIWRDCE